MAALTHSPAPRGGRGNRPGGPARQQREERAMSMTRGNWTDEACYYVSVIDTDTDRRALLAGPFAHQRQAAAAVRVVRQAAECVDARAVWYAYGTCRAPNGHYDGGLNAEIDFERLPHRPRQAVRRPDRYGF
uniref:Uncharacterized protein n=1 Tax=viral metagenome TaxID=1070528 RepID=A0A6M3IPV8_9ZZZZ